jgi:polysaccharide export outer membrane protein
MDDGRAFAPRVPIRAWLKPVRVIAMIGAVGLLAACAGSRGGNIPYDVVLEAPDRPTPLSVEEDYKISPLDTLSVSVFQVADLSRDYEVDLTGNISVPLIGRVKAVDMTMTQLDERLTTILGEKYLQNPDVSIGLKSSSARVITVDGAVQNPGVFPVNRQMTLLQVIAMAKGVNGDANPKRVAIFRQIQGQRMAAAFDLTSIRRGKAEDPKVYSGDIVVVDGSSIRALQREILSAIPLLSVFNPLAL